MNRGGVCAPPFLSQGDMKQLVILLAIVLGFAACRERGKVTIVSDSVNETEMYLTTKDTAAVETLVRMFMDRTQRGRLDSAAMLLRTYDLHRQPQGLDSAGFRKVMETLGQFRVLGYDIEHVVFRSAGDNEVKCRVRVADDACVSWRFKPVRYIGRWSLCLKEAGDSTLK